jgi:hypothetical protein
MSEKVRINYLKEGKNGIKNKISSIINELES